jgi:hypothetical protein
MARTLPKLRISSPTGPTTPGRGFYQLEESSLYVQIGLFSTDTPFFSWLESERVRFDIDQDGRLLFIEVDAGRHTWKEVPDLSLPAYSQPAELRWLDFRSSIPDPAIFTNHDRTTIHLRFPGAQPHRTLEIAEKVIVEVTEELCLAGLYVTELIDDLAGQEIARFREQCRKGLSSASK